MRSTNRDSYLFNEIALDEARELPEVFFTLLKKWRELADQSARENKVNWFSKGVSVVFFYGEKEYRLIAEDFFNDEIVEKINTGKVNGGYYHAVVETLSSMVKKDLLDIGATNVVTFGYLD